MMDSRICPTIHQLQIVLVQWRARRTHSVVELQHVTVARFRNVRMIVTMRKQNGRRDAPNVARTCIVFWMVLHDKASDTAMTWQTCRSRHGQTWRRWRIGHGAVLSYGSHIPAIWRVMRIDADVIKLGAQRSSSCCFELFS